MNTVQIPVTSDPVQTLAVVLDGATYTLNVRWNARAGAWFFDVLDEAGAMLKAGCKILCDWPLTGWRDRNPDLPPGVIWASNTTGSQEPPGVDDLGSTVLLLYDEVIT